MVGPPVHHSSFQLSIKKNARNWRIKNSWRRWNWRSQSSLPIDYYWWTRTLDSVPFTFDAIIYGSTCLSFSPRLSVRVYPRLCFFLVSKIDQSNLLERRERRNRCAVSKNTMQYLLASINFHRLSSIWFCWPVCQSFSRGLFHRKLIGRE